MKVNLIKKYNVPAPRYTSYPTVPYWNENDFNYDDYISLLRKNFSQSNNFNGISIYIHLPFCEKLCTFCGCNKRITKNHNVELPYINALLKEWDLYLQILNDSVNDKIKIKELHLGGGTPTFFSPDNLKLLLNKILEKTTIANNYVFGFEANPNNTSFEHLQTLYELGFKRVSFGVQDYDPVVQKIINRIQPFENVKRVTYQARDIGYKSICHDLVFGLPKQSIDSIKYSIEKTNLLKPDRISFYSYAHVPWIKGVGQRKFSETDLPKDEYKRKLYETGKIMLEQAGYYEIGMDHFALKHDDLYKAMINGTLHRNFMGYTPFYTKLLIGLGVSSISDTWTAFAQNVKNLEEYYNKLNDKKIPVFRGHILNNEDIIIRKHILNIMCKFKTEFTNEELYLLKESFEKLKEMMDDGLVIFNSKSNTLMVTEKGKTFVRNICMAFDLRLLRNKPQTKIFSNTI